MGTIRVEIHLQVWFREEVPRLKQSEYDLVTVCFFKLLNTCEYILHNMNVHILQQVNYERILFQMTHLKNAKRTLQFSRMDFDRYPVSNLL